MNPHPGRQLRMSNPTHPTGKHPQQGREILYRLINDLANPHFRKNALLEISKRRDCVPDLGPMLWNSFGTVSLLLQEIVNVYPYINPPTLNTNQSNTVCNALALLQSIGSHPETRHSFLSANIHRFIYPFLEIKPNSRALEFLKLTSLGVIGALLRNDDQEVVNVLLSSEIMPYCLRNMEIGNDLNRTVAAFILQRILAHDLGLNYICQTYERFSHVAMILGKLVMYLINEPPSNLIRHVIRIYLRLSENPRAREALRQCLPDQLRDNTLVACLKNNDVARSWLALLHQNLKDPVPQTPAQMQMPIPVPMQTSMQMPMQIPMQVQIPMQLQMPEENVPYIMQ